MVKDSTPGAPIYPYTEWDIVEEQFSVQNNYRNETIFALANGYIGMRGTFEEGYHGPAGTGLEGTYLNGFYESEPIRYPETAYGYAKDSQTMLNVTNGKIVQLLLDGEAFNMLSGELKEYRRVLREREGLLERTLVWRSPQGREIRLDIKRLVSFARRHLAAISYEVTPLNFSGEIRIISALDGDVTNLTAANDPRVGSGLQGRVLLVQDKMAEGSFGAIAQKTQHTGFTLVCAMENRLDTVASYTAGTAREQSAAKVLYNIDAKQDTPMKFYKYLAYVTSRDYPEAELMDRARNVVTEARHDGFAVLHKEQEEFLAAYWDKADVVIKGDVALQQGIRFNMFHLLQSVGRDGKTNIAAKGLTGEGYEGHYFWDTEIYVIPFFLYNNPGISRKLLEFRYNTLDKARERAREMAQPRGALFPWRTINGEECSAYFPAGTAQYHIDADVAYAIKRYLEVTQDNEFLVNYGAEIVLETARLWADLGAYIPRKGNRFCINEVTGPDEYKAVVNNNCYTNLMAKLNLSYAYDIVQWMQKMAPDAYARLAARIGLEEGEPEQWKKAADSMYIPYDDDLKIYMQDDSFLDRAPWDFERTPPENYPLLIHYHPLVIYRYQVCKQADLVLALFLLSQKFTSDEKKRNYDFYEKLTTHDSSLSTCIFSIVASEIGYREKAYRYFMNTARMDLDDTHANVHAGIHVANMAGTWLCLVNGFAGMRVYDDVLSFSPYLPEGWESYSFKVVYRGCLLGITVDKSQATYELISGDNAVFQHHDERVTLATRGTISLPTG